MIRKLDHLGQMVNTKIGIFFLVFLFLSCNNNDELLQNEFRINNEYYKKEFEFYFYFSKNIITDKGRGGGMLSLIDIQKEIILTYSQLDTLLISKKKNEIKLKELNIIIKLINKRYDYGIELINSKYLEFLNEKLKDDYFELFINRTKFKLSNEFYFDCCKGGY